LAGKSCGAFQVILKVCILKSHARGNGPYIDSGYGIVCD